MAMGRRGVRRPTHATPRRHNSRELSVRCDDAAVLGHRRFALEAREAVRLFPQRAVLVDVEVVRLARQGQGHGHGVRERGRRQEKDGEHADANRSVHAKTLRGGMLPGASGHRQGIHNFRPIAYVPEKRGAGSLGRVLGAPHVLAGAAVRLEGAAVRAGGGNVGHRAGGVDDLVGLRAWREAHEGGGEEEADDER